MILGRTAVDPDSVPSGLYWNRSRCGNYYLGVGVVYSSGTVDCFAAIERLGVIPVYVI